uniref:Uncharacterized protein n=1 Tax=Anguilla anguilla TaxID=7936 RepID=A0A0E9R7W1_ANGAN
MILLTNLMLIKIHFIHFGVTYEI